VLRLGKMASVAELEKPPSPQRAGAGASGSSVQFAH
jgi:hypothetical protein